MLFLGPLRVMLFVLPLAILFPLEQRWRLISSPAILLLLASLLFEVQGSARESTSACLSARLGASGSLAWWCLVFAALGYGLVLVVPW